MWTSSDHYLAPPPPPGGRGRLWSALLLLAVGVVTLAVLAVVAIAVVLGGYQKPREPIQQGPPRRVAPSATWGEEVPDEQLPSRLLTQQRLRTTVRHFPHAEITTSSTTSTSTTTTSTTTTSAPKLPTFKVKGSVDFDQKQQQQTQRRDWPTETHEHEWRPGEVAVVQDPAELLSTTAATHLPARSYIGIKGDLVLPTLFPPTSTDTEKPRLVGTTDIPALDLGMIDSISKSFTNMAIRVRPQHPMQTPIHKLSSTPEPTIPAIQETTVSSVISSESIPLESEVETVPDSVIPSITEFSQKTSSNNTHYNQPIVLGIATPAENINESDDITAVQGISSSEISYKPHFGIVTPEEINESHNPMTEIIASDSKDEQNIPVTTSDITNQSKPTMQEIDFAHDTQGDETSDSISADSNHSDISSPADSEREEKSITEIVPTVSDTTTTYLENNETEISLLDTTLESVTEFFSESEETTTTIPEDLHEDSASVVTPLPTLQQMTSRAAVERTAKQDHISADGTQLVQREPKGTLVQAFPSSEFNSSPAFLRNRKRNMTTTTTTQKPPKIVANCTCAARLEAQGLSRKICDGVLDCWDYSDEENCEWCAPGRHVCAHSRACVPKSKLCDGRRDCPFGDDERNCVAVAPDRKQADSLEYHDAGLLMVQKTGVWGTLCVEKLEGSAWRLGDVARAVCRALTYGDFELAEQVQVSRSAGPYYELNLQLGRNGGSTSNGSPRLAVDSTDCPSRAAVRLGCRDLQCGVRPLAGNQWASDESRAGAMSVAALTRSPPPRRRGSRIVGGGNAGPGAWPWQAALYKEGQFQCGGSLIAAQWLLSASHCFAHNLDAYWVARMGALRRGTDLASPFEQLRRVVRIVQHPGYLDHGFVNDLALLRLEKPVLFSDFIRPVCLPPADAEEPGPEGQMCTVVGWGQLSEVGRIFPDTLQEVQLPLISTEECRKRTLFLPLYRVTEDMFCAGFERGGRDACLGDSGGPLMCQRSDARWELTGITSNGYGCARANRPGVYTKVANYVRWIAQVMDSDRAINTTAPACPKGQQRCALGHCSAPPDGSCGKLYCPAA